MRRSQRKRKSSPHPPAPTTTNATDALITMTKAPIPGEVKTRLCPPLTPDEASTLHGSFVLDELERSRKAIKTQALRVHRYLGCAPSPDHAFFRVLEARQEVRLLPQIGDDLGARMHHAFDQLFQRGYQRIIMVGTDLPDLPPTTYVEALTLLNEHDLVLGPAVDGGYYLIGMKQPNPDLFSNIPWSTNQVTARTLERAKVLGLSHACLPPGHDIDSLDDLLNLIQHSSSKEGTRAPLSQRTSEVLHTLIPRLKQRGVFR